MHFFSNPSSFNLEKAISENCLSNIVILQSQILVFSSAIFNFRSSSFSFNSYFMGWIFHGIEWIDGQSNTNNRLDYDAFVDIYIVSLPFILVLVSFCMFRELFGRCRQLDNKQIGVDLIKH